MLGKDRGEPPGKLFENLRDLIDGAATLSFGPSDGALRSGVLRLVNDGSVFSLSYLWSSL